MEFKRTLLGLNPREVKLYISELEQMVAVKTQQLNELKRSFRELEYENESLEMRLKISEELRTGHQFQAEAQEDVF